MLHALFGGKLVLRDSLAQMTTLCRVPDEFPPAVTPSYGLGLMADPDGEFGPEFGHGGAGPGYDIRVAHFAEMAGTLMGFYEARESLKHNQPKPEDLSAGFAWNSPRTWDQAIRAIATIRSLGMNEKYEQIFVEGCVGEGAGAVVGDHPS